MVKTARFNRKVREKRGRKFLGNNKFRFHVSKEVQLRERKCCLDTVKKFCNPCFSISSSLFGVIEDERPFLRMNTTLIVLMDIGAMRASINNTMWKVLHRLGFRLCLSGKTTYRVANGNRRYSISMVTCSVSMENRTMVQEF